MDEELMDELMDDPSFGTAPDPKRQRRNELALQELIDGMPLSEAEEREILAELGVAARRADGRIGIWTEDRDGREAKIGALGIRVRRWVTLHGFSINVDPDLSHFGGIVPCGISEFPVTSVAAVGGNASMAALDAALRAHFPSFLNNLRRCGPALEQCATGG